MTLNDFINTYNGKGVDTDGAYGNQCMDLMHAYVRDVLGLGTGLFAAPTAYQAYLNASDGRFDKIGNTPAGVPSPGDIIFWNTSVGSAGHVAIFIDGNTQQFRSFDQNWPTGSVSHVQTHNYNGVAGWLHLKSTSNQGANTVADVTVTTDELRIIHSELEGWPLADTHAGKFDAQFNASWGGHGLREVLWEKWNKNGGWRDRRQAALNYMDTKGANDQLIANLQTQNADLSAKVADLQKQLDAKPVNTDTKWETFKSLIRELIK